LAIARLDEEVPAHKALRHHIDLTLGRLPSREWKRPPGRPLAGGSTRSAGTTITLLLQTSGGLPSDVVTVERRYGPRWLRDDDDELVGRSFEHQLIQIFPFPEITAADVPKVGRNG